MAVKRPPGLAAGGRALWKAITEAHVLDAAQVVILMEACRAKDRLDKLELVSRGDVDAWGTVNSGSEVYELQVDAASAVNSTATLLKQLLAALRLPDEVTGRRPQRRGGGRGVYRR